MRVGVFGPRTSRNGAIGAKPFRVFRILSRDSCYTSLVVVFLFLSLILSACSHQTTPAATQTTPSPDLTRVISTNQPSGETPTGVPTTPELATPTHLTPTPPLPTQATQILSHYTLTVRIDYDLHYLSVEEQITYVNNSGEALTELVLVVDPNLYEGVFHLKGLTWENGSTINNYQLAGHQMKIPLDKPRSTLTATESLSIALVYELNLPNREAVFGFTNRQINLGDWYPYVPPYISGTGWLVHDSTFYGEHLVYEMADFQVNIQLTKPQSATGGLLTIAASDLIKKDGDWYRFTHNNARNFALSISDQYKVLTGTVGEVTLKAYSFPSHPDADQPALQAAMDALKLYSEIFSPYPHKSLAVVEGDFLDGMEYDGLIFLSHAFYDYFTGDARNNLVIIAAHETAHQWWYAMVGNDQALEPWLDEALCTYTELLFYEHVYPDLAQWWWDNRIYFHKPDGWVDITIYQIAGYRPYRMAVYLRGALFMQDLRSVMGDEAFFAFLKDYVNRYSNKIATGDNFFAVVKEHTSADLSNLIKTYFAKR